MKKNGGVEISPKTNILFLSICSINVKNKMANRKAILNLKITQRNDREEWEK